MWENLYYSWMFASKLSEGSNNNCLFLISHAHYYRVFVSVWLTYFVVKSNVTSLAIAFIGHLLRLLLIFRENKSVFLVKCPCAEITQLSSWLISFTSVQRSELWYGNQVYTANFISVYKILTFFGPLHSLCITEYSWLTIIQLYIPNFERNIKYVRLLRHSQFICSKHNKESFRIPNSCEFISIYTKPINFCMQTLNIPIWY